MEVDGESVISRTDSELYKLLNSKDDGMKVVVLRPVTDQSSSADDVESLRDDLSLALLELEAVQNENKQLTAEIDLYVSLRSVLVIKCTKPVIETLLNDVKTK